MFRAVDNIARIIMAMVMMVRVERNRLHRLDTKKFTVSRVVAYSLWVAGAADMMIHANDLIG